jgi:hypothetical protein
MQSLLNLHLLQNVMVSAATESFLRIILLNSVWLILQIGCNADVIELGTVRVKRKGILME